MKTIVRNTIKQQVTQVTLEAIQAKPEYLMPLFPMTSGRYSNSSYEAQISHKVLIENGYEYLRYENCPCKIKIAGKELHGNKGVYFQQIF